MSLIKDVFETSIVVPEKLNKSISDNHILKGNPASLNNTIIQSIGKNYLKAHDKMSMHCLPRFFDSLFHSNQPTALKLKNYAAVSDCYDKWQFLADCYASLVKGNGELSNAILTTFTLAFNKGIFAYKLLHITNNINEYIYDDYVFSPQEVSNALKILIADRYINEIRRLHHSAFRVSTVDPILFANSKPDSITNTLIQQIGIDYLDAYPADKKPCTLNLCTHHHNNQSTAKKLKNYNSSCDSYEKWIFLANIYSELDKSKGELSNQILSAFLHAFGKAPYTREKLRYKPGYYGGNVYSSYYSPALVSISLKGMVNEHYAKKYRSELQITCSRSDSVLSVSAGN